MKDFILRNIERVFSLLLTGIFLALLYFGNEKGLHLWFDSGRESGTRSWCLSNSLSNDDTYYL